MYLQDVLPLQPPFQFRSLSLAYKLCNLFLCSSYICQTSFPTARFFTFLFSSESFDDSDVCCLQDASQAILAIDSKAATWMTYLMTWVTYLPNRLPAGFHAAKPPPHCSREPPHWVRAHLAGSSPPQLVLLSSHLLQTFPFLSLHQFKTNSKFTNQHRPPIFLPILQPEGPSALWKSFTHNSYVIKIKVYH